VLTIYVYHSKLQDKEAEMNTRIKEIRERKGIGQIELAEKSGVSRTVISQLENGKRDIVTSDTMKNIAEALGEPIGKIFLF
jgi:DNA-binding helix-turn-helix protein